MDHPEPEGRTSEPSFCLIEEPGRGSLVGLEAGPVLEELGGLIDVDELLVELLLQEEVPLTAGQLDVLHQLDGRGGSPQKLKGCLS